MNRPDIEPTVKPLDIEPPKVKQPELVPPKSTVDVSTKATEKEFSSTQVTSAWTEPIKISEPKPAQALAPGAQQTKNVSKKLDKPFTKKYI